MKHVRVRQQNLNLFADSRALVLRCGPVVARDQMRVRRALTSERARPGVVHGLGVWWKKFGAAGTNVNELTHQRLTDIGRAPSFYDCLVEVQVAEHA